MGASTDSQKQSWAPVVITVYDRVKHFRQTLSSLAQNEGADQTTLYVSSDGPKNAEARPRVEKIRRMIAEQSGFKDVIPWAPSKNSDGRVREELLQYVRNNHEAYIFSEDDNVFSPFFLRFMNDGLRGYFDNHDVRAICGFLPPGVNFNTPHQVFLKSFSAWGYGTWSQREHSDTPQNLARKTFEHSQLFREMNQNLPHLPRLNRRVLVENLQAEDVHTINDMLVRKQLGVFPPQSLVRNIGNDGSGLNCRPDLRFQEQEVAASAVYYDLGLDVRADSKNSAKVSRFFGGRIVQIANFLIRLEFISEDNTFRSVLGYVNKQAIAWARKIRNYFLGKHKKPQQNRRPDDGERSEN